MSLDLLSTEERGVLTAEECKNRIIRRNILPSDFLPFDLERVKKADEFVINYFKKLSKRHRSHIVHAEILEESKPCQYEQNKCLKRFLRYSRSHVWALINYFENQDITVAFPSLKESVETLESDIEVYENNLLSSGEKQKYHVALGRGYLILSMLPTDSVEQKNEYMKKSWKNFSNIKKITSKTIYLWKAQLLQKGLILENEDLTFKEWDSEKNNQQNTKVIYDNLLNILNTKKEKKERKNVSKSTSVVLQKEKNPLIPYCDQLTQKNMKEQLYQLNLDSFAPVENNANQQNDNTDVESSNSEEFVNIIYEIENPQNLNNDNNFWYDSEGDQSFLQQNQSDDCENLDGESLNSEELENILQEENNHQNSRNNNNEDSFLNDPEEDQPFVQRLIPSSNNSNNREKRKENSNLNGNANHKKKKHNPKVNLDEKINYIRECADKGISVDFIASNLGCNTNRLKTFMVEKNIMISKKNNEPKKSWTVETLQEAYNLYKNEGKKQREIATTYNISTPKISSNFKELDKIDKNDPETLKKKIEEIVKNQIK